MNLCEKKNTITASLAIVSKSNESIVLNWALTDKAMVSAREEAWKSSCCNHERGNAFDAMVATELPFFIPRRKHRWRWLYGL
jgi:hypothetical protein